MTEIEKVKDFIRKQADIVKDERVQKQITLCKPSVIEGVDIGEIFGIDTNFFDKPFYYRRVDTKINEMIVVDLSVSHARKIYQFLKEIFE
jgi:hypothetical protein